MHYLKKYTVRQSTNVNRQSNPILGELITIASIPDGVSKARLAWYGIEADVTIEAVAKGLWALYFYVATSFNGIACYRVYETQEGIWLPPLDELGVIIPAFKSNVGISGTLSRDSEMLFTLEIAIAGILTGNKNGNFTLSGESLQTIVANAYQFARFLGEKCGVEYSAASSDLSGDIPQAFIVALGSYEHELFQCIVHEDIDSDDLVASAEAMVAATGNATNFPLESVLIAALVASLQYPLEIEPKGQRAILALLKARQSWLSTLSLSDLLIATGSIGQAIALLESAEMYHDMPEYALQLATAWAMSGRVEKALEVVRQAITANAVNAEIFRLYGTTLNYRLDQMTGEYDEKSVFNYDNIREDSHHAFFRAYELGSEMSDLQEALIASADSDAFERYLALVVNENHVALFDTVTELLEDPDEVTAAIDRIEGVVDLNPAFKPERLVWLAKLYLALDNIEAATECLSEAESTGAEQTNTESVRMRLYSHDVDARLAELQLKSTSQKITLADIDFLEQILALAPHRLDLFPLLVETYKAVGDTEAALEIVSETDTSWSNYETLQQMGIIILWEQGDHEASIQRLVDLIETYPQSASSRALLARYLFEADRADEARAYLLQADALEPENVMLRQTREIIGRTMVE